MFPEAAVEVMVEMAVAAGRPLNWNTLRVDSPETVEARLAVSDRARDAGATIVALTVPAAIQLRVNLPTSIAYNDLPTWSEVRVLPLDERLKAMADPHFRERMAADVARNPRPNFLDFGPMIVESVVHPKLSRLVGRTVGEIAAEGARTPLDAFLDIAVE